MQDGGVMFGTHWSPPHNAFLFHLKKPLPEETLKVLEFKIWDFGPTRHERQGGTVYTLTE